jgi:GMP synthase (glutamine-hydrolysing)
VRALLLSGFGTDWGEFDFTGHNGLLETVRSLEIPTLGICGGHQFLGWAFGAPWGPLGPLDPGEADAHPDIAPGMRKEMGKLRVQLVAEDPLFAGLSEQPVVDLGHYWQLLEVPTGWRLLASSPICRVQAMRHPERPLYGTQFHPHFFDEQHQDGKQILDNFFQIAGIVPQAEEVAQMTAWRRYLDMVAQRQPQGRIS